ncbi:hypothetical protein CC80DRAFT_469186 [Byssothecium circinans]|uniref:Uncharacterized protein n=1 Tax=Byssothecium circinans TaxID=147558 RepID=A0A6A5U1W1_9PLEO|nr:hypothetical protein CC80DRAFT_469186 [Byssothecium circinans]
MYAPTMSATQIRKPSGPQHQHQPDAQTPSLPKPRHSHSHSHSRTFTAPVTPTPAPALLRLPSTSSSSLELPSPLPLPTSPRSRRSSSSATSPSYFSPQTAPSSTARRPPASFSGHGIDTSRGPPITLITRGNSDIARRTSHQPADVAFAHPQFAHFTQANLLSPDTASHGSRGRTPRRGLSRQTSTSDTSPRQQPMASADEGSSEYNPASYSRFGNSRAISSRRRATHTAGDGAQEDLFLNLAADNAAQGPAPEAPSRSDRLQSRIARASNRQSFPSVLQTTQPSSATTNGSRIPSTVDTKAGVQSGVQSRRASLIPSRAAREQLPLTPSNPTDPSRSRIHDLSPQTSFSTRKQDSDLSPKEFLASLEVGRRRPSYPDATHTPPHRANAYRPSNLHYYSSSHDNLQTPVVATPQPTQQQETAPRVEGTESHGSTGPATSVWDELDELKTRIRRIEMGGKIPATASAVISQATADRPRTANTSVTTVSSSPNQQKKAAPSPSESTVGVQTPNKVHPLLGDALAKAKQHTTPAVFRVLEATAAEALALAEMTGSAGPQGTLQSASSILNGASIPDRQVRRKADNICRSLTELCIALCDTKPSLASPAFRSITAPSRRSSVQVNGDSPTIRHSIEPESNTISQSSPSTALSRIEARRVSMLAGGTYGSPRESSQEPPTASQNQIPSRSSRAGTSLHRPRPTTDDEDDDPTLRAPSRAFTDFRDIRSSHKPRFSREYISREPMPGLEPSALQHTTSLRRPTAPGLSNETNLLYKDGSRRYGIDRQGTSAYEKRASAEPSPRTQFSANRNSIGGYVGLGRSGSLNRRLRGKSAGE